MDFLSLFSVYVLLVAAAILLVCRYSGRRDSPALSAVSRVSLSPGALYHAYSSIQGCD